MIVDDEKISRDGIRLTIERARLSYAIYEFSNGPDALNWMEDHAADMALVDMKMPMMSGVEFIKSVSGGVMKCIVLSGYSEFNYAAESMKYGALEYLLKPVHRDELIAAIKKTEALILKEEDTADKLQKADLINQSRYDTMASRLNHMDLKKSCIDQAIKYIEENYANNINMAVVANALSMEYTYFSKMFKNETNINFIDYLRKYRIERAMEYLIATDYKIAEIAMRVGYPNPKNFTTSFKQFSGVTPQEYRNQFLTARIADQN